MAVVFEPGNNYYKISAGEYDILKDYISDFDIADDGYYYALIGSIDDEELELMDDLEIIPDYFAYKKSTQSTSPI